MLGSEMKDHIVDFEKWCPKCLYHDKSESEDPCWDCLEDGVAFNGMPIKFKEKDA